MTNEVLEGLLKDVEGSDSDSNAEDEDDVEKVGEDREGTSAGTAEINRGAYHGGTFNGVHCRLLMTDAEQIFEDIKAYLLSVDHETKLATEEEIIETCDTLKHLLVELDIAFSILRMPYGTPGEKHFTMLKEALDEIEKLWNRLGLSHTPKFHALMRHALEQMRIIGGFGEMLEDHVEKSHQDMDKFHQRVATLRSFEMRAKSYSHHEKTANDPKVLAAGREAIDKTSRKRKAGPSLAVGRRSDEKVARDDTRLDNHTAEQMRPAGEKIKPHERTKLEHRNNSI
jgi:hypothetical protein